MKALFLNKEMDLFKIRCRKLHIFLPPAAMADRQQARRVDAASASSWAKLQ